MLARNAALATRDMRAQHVIWLISASLHDPKRLFKLGKKDSPGVLLDRSRAGQKLAPAFGVIPSSGTRDCTYGLDSMCSRIAFSAATSSGFVVAASS